MHWSRLFRTLLALFIIPAGLWYSGFGVAESAAAGQKRGGSKPNENAALLEARASGPLDRCGVKHPSATEVAMIEEALNATSDSNRFVTIPVYWHIITTATGGGNVSSLVPAQMAVLNNEFGDSGFAFKQAGLEVVANNDWFFAEAVSAEEQQMKAALRKGGPDALNIYTPNGDVYLGWATLPAFYKFAPTYDGVVVWWATLPGGGAEFPSANEPDGVVTYDLGDTGTHEVGHWLGLDHTFGTGNGCLNPGDQINDTPIEAEPQFYCRARDSCVGAQFRGTDPITNFMDYTDDVCINEFTSEQSKRMRMQWHAFRDKKAR